MASGGLGNLGATCAVNALIQCVTHTRSLREYFLNNTFNESTLAHQFKDVIQLIYVQKATVAPHALLQRLYSYFPMILHHGEQHDICELWMLISDKIAEEVGKPIQAPPKTLEEDPNNIENKLHHMIYRSNNKCTSPWIDMIQGIQIGVLQCKNEACVEQYYNPEVFTTITVDIPTNKHTDLTELLLDFYNVDEMDGWKCDKCKEVCGARKQAKLFNLPKVLVIVIKRFKMTEIGSFQKIMRGININNDLEFTFNNKTYKYVLSTYGNHLGNYHGGHYTASVRTTASDDNTSNKEWLYYDDTNSNPIPNESSQFIDNREAYILFYEMIE